MASTYIYDYVKFRPHFDTLEDLTADTSLAYAATGNKYRVDVGDYVTAGTQSYVVISSGGTAHETTAGGVKLYEAGPNFSTLARFQAWNTDYDASDGTVFTADGSFYEANSGSTSVSGLPDWDLISIGAGSGTLRRARVLLGSDQAISANTTTALSFDSGATGHVDEGSWFSSGNPTRLTVPSGVSQIVLKANVIGASQTGQLTLSFLKNGSDFAGNGGIHTETAARELNNVVSDILDVTAGDYFECAVYSDLARNITAGNQTWFSVQEITNYSATGSNAYDIRSGFTSTPTSSEVLDTIMVGRALTIPANMSGSIGTIGTNPTGSFAIDVKDDGTTIGTITISTGGTFTFATTSGAEKSVAAGSVLTFVAPSSTDATAANAVWTILGTV